MYLSKLQKFILRTSFKNLSIENLDLESDAIHKFFPKEKEKEKKIDIINASIDQLLVPFFIKSFELVSFTPPSTEIIKLF